LDTTTAAAVLLMKVLVPCGKLFKILGTDERQQLFLCKEQNQYWMLETINEQLKTISTNIQKFKAT
jgi:hypothetical protein